MGFGRVWVIKYNSQFGNLTKRRNVESAVELGLHPISSKMRHASECDRVRVRILKKMKSHMRTRRGWWGDSQLRNKEGDTRVQGKTQDGKGTERSVVTERECVLKRRRCVWLQGDVLTQPRVSRGSSRAKHIIIQAGGEPDWTVFSDSISTSMHAWGMNSNMSLTCQWLQIIPSERNQYRPFSLDKMFKLFLAVGFNTFHR